MHRPCSQGAKRQGFASRIALLILLAGTAGCGDSSGVVQGDLGAEARKALIQKKVDVQQRSSGSR